jgi:hypothetical protein
LSVSQRFEIAEVLRDAADALDRGRVMSRRPAPPLASHLARRLVRTDKHDFDGRQLYKIIPNW